jgi:uncharacterized cofD-like protein
VNVLGWGDAVGLVFLYAINNTYDDWLTYQAPSCFHEDGNGTLSINWIRFMKARKISLLLLPGLGVKRWIVALICAISSLGLGIAFLVAVPVSPIVLPFLRFITLSHYPVAIRGGVFLGLGAIVCVASVIYLYKAIVLGASGGRRGVNVIENLYDHRFRSRGPRIVAIGGGTGLSVLLSGLKTHTDNLTAIVTMADDGGSSGRLRRDLDMPPPGDARNCIVALSRYESMVGELFDYRFTSAGDLTGHSLGNLLLAALHDTQGGFENALIAAGSILGLTGRVVPVSNNNLVLVAETGSGDVLMGESVIGKSGEDIKALHISPDTAYISESAVAALAHADLVVVGPGSLYTSILPNLLVPGMRDALRACSAPIVFVCNVVTQPFESMYTNAEDYVRAIQYHGKLQPTHILMNTNIDIGELFGSEDFVRPSYEIGDFEGDFVFEDLLNRENSSQHDPERLAEALIKIFHKN